MDANVLGSDVHNVNVLTVIASESYESFAKGLQTEIAEAVADRPKKVTRELFLDMWLRTRRVMSSLLRPMWHLQFTLI